MALRQLQEDKASCSQRLRTSTLLGRWAAEWQKSRQKYVAELFISNLVAHRDNWADHESSLENLTRASDQLGACLLPTPLLTPGARTAPCAVSSAFESRVGSGFVVFFLGHGI